jgi:hypothetical protein
VSHYSTSYTFLIVLFLAWLGLRIYNMFFQAPKAAIATSGSRAAGVAPPDTS